ncbi:type 2 lanthipeptide synthetase LanM family protein [Virgisporangium ochraceum]|uniref:Lanthionine synthetase n=1 Tax=Virgisporangium ochraceum TaxID=65505 RepID=A0A8J4A5F8_9ACTN|nr:type 2 lanthipeptide synthetase LanM family protein [Virgisporangium ochraceum]GIJ73715.1 lanthionine synthetase [Virgisporangium ochraceum]
MPQTQVADAVLGSLVTPSLAHLATRLGSVNGMTGAERDVVHTAAASALQDALQLRTNRVLLVELHAARLSGRLTADDATARWRQWQELAAGRGFWESLSEHYPTLLDRLARMVGNRCDAAFAFARRFAADRPAIAGLVGTDPGELVEVEFGAGDSHRGGQTVALVRCSGARLVYKPRSVAVDVALDRFLAGFLTGPDRIRVPAVVVGDGYGWAAHVEHRYCADDAELHTFYRNLGHWLAVMRLLGGSDLHAENLVAAGPVPVVVDCETLFTPPPPERPSGYGLATDRAGALVGNTVLGTGLLPGRGLGLGWRGIDMSAIGSLPGQQPTSRLPVIVDDGTDLARMGYADVPAPTALNHPSPKPVLGRFWDDVVTGFEELTGRLRGLDTDGRLDLTGFADVPIRVVLRSTESYAEVGRMLWHPRSLHDEPAARRHAADLLARQAANAPGRPDDPVVIDAEVADLLVADVPMFTTTPGDGRMDGPGGTVWGDARDLVGVALDRWRATDVALERLVIRSAMVSAYLNEGWLPEQRRLTPSTVRADDLDRRRRAAAHGIVRDVVDSAIHAEDGTVTWIAAGLAATGWAVLPLALDMYAGSPGVAVLLAAYAREMARGRADPVEEVPRLLEQVLHTMRTAETQWVADRARVRQARPESPGGYVGVGSRIWGWLLLGRLGAVDRAEALRRAGDLLVEVPGTLSDDAIDLMHGMAGTVVPLMRLHEGTGSAEALALAVTIGERLTAAATVRDGLAWWTTSPMLPEGIGGLAHGATGISWALARLAAVTGDARAREVAAMGFDYEETLYEPGIGGWRDLRTPDVTVAAWCHGAGGIGVVAADLMRTGFGDGDRWRDVLRRAGEACRSHGTGWNHTICHGDLGAWEVMRLALDGGVGPDGVNVPGLSAFVLSGLEKYGPVSGFARDVFTPGLLPGLGGVAYQLLRMHPDSDLPSVMLPDPGAP